jgi:hypothetical protein
MVVACAIGEAVVEQHLLEVLSRELDPLICPAFLTTSRDSRRFE